MILVHYARHGTNLEDVFVLANADTQDDDALLRRGFERQGTYKLVPVEGGEVEMPSSGVYENAKSAWKKGE